MKERLQKILARAGVASRRAAEELIVAGRVRVNGRIVTELGVTADPRHDRVDLDGKRVVREPLVYVLYHKPRGMVATMKDPEGRPAVGEVVEKIGVRVVPVGRLDFHTSGALLLTNDGELTDALLHPKREVPKVYVAKVRGALDVKELDLLRNGVVLDDGEKTRPANVFVLREESGSTWIEITLYEGKNRQIHRMGDAIGHAVLRLVRMSFAGISTEGLRPGQWRPLDGKELERLQRDWVTPRRESDAQDAREIRAGARPPRARENDDAREAPGHAVSAGSSRVPARGAGVGTARGPRSGGSSDATRGPGDRGRGPSAGGPRGGGSRGPSFGAPREPGAGSRGAGGGGPRGGGGSRGPSFGGSRDPGASGPRAGGSRGPGAGGPRGDGARAPGRGDGARGSSGGGPRGDGARGPSGGGARGPGRDRRDEHPPFDTRDARAAERAGPGRRGAARSGGPPDTHGGPPRGRSGAAGPRDERGPRVDRPRRGR